MPPKRQIDDMARLGPCSVPLVPRSDLTRFRITLEDLKSTWRIIGPTASYNLDRNPLWKVICFAYLEGLYHGAELEAEIERRSKQKSEENEQKDQNYDG